MRPLSGRILLCPFDGESRPIDFCRRTKIEAQRHLDEVVKGEKVCTSLLLWRGGFVCDRGHFEKYPLVDVEAASAQYRGTLRANDFEPAGVQAARFDFRVASIS